MTLIPFYIITDYNIPLKNAAFSFFFFICKNEFSFIYNYGIPENQTV